MHPASQGTQDRLSEAKPIHYSSPVIACGRNGLQS